MVILRVERKGGVGPYGGASGLSCRATERHPAPYQDVPDWDNRNRSYEWRFGFRDIEQLRRWFDKQERQILAEQGFRIVAVWTELVLPGTRQVAFAASGRVLGEWEMEEEEQLKLWRE